MPARTQRRGYAAVYKQGIMAGYESLDLVGKVLPCVGRALDSLLISAWRGQRDLGALDKPAGMRRLICWSGRSPSCGGRTSVDDLGRQRATMPDTAGRVPIESTP